MSLLTLLTLFIALPQDSPSETPTSRQTQASAATTSTKEEKKSQWQAGTSNLRDLVEAMGNAPLLKVPAIQGELKLTPLQQEKLNALLLHRAEEWSERSDKLTVAMIYGQRQAAKDGVFFNSPLRAVSNQYKADTATDVKGVLSPKQYRRYRELQVQLLGPVALLDPELQDRLNLSPDVRAELDEVYAQYRRERLTLLRTMGQTHVDAWKKVMTAPGASETRWLDVKTEKSLDDSAAKIEVLEKQVNREIIRRLTKKQRQAFQNMAGEPFALKDLVAPGGANSFTPGASLAAAARAARDKAAAKPESAPKTTEPSTKKK